MQRGEFNYFSQKLQRNMRVLIYGTSGVPILAFPPQSSMCNTYEDFGLLHEVEGYINEGKTQWFCVDTIDDESWAGFGKDNGYRAWQQELYFQYIIEEVLPLIQFINPTHTSPYTFGVSLGATHAAICFFRRPDLFKGVLSLSSVMDSIHFFGDWMNDVLYQNSPTAFLSNMEKDHPFINLYNQKPIICCVGQGDWEDVCADSLRRFQEQLNRLDIHAWIDYWGYDVNHDWYWWKKQLLYFLPHLLENEG